MYVFSPNQFSLFLQIIFLVHSETEFSPLTLKWEVQKIEIILQIIVLTIYLPCTQSALPLFSQLVTYNRGR